MQGGLGWEAVFSSEEGCFVAGPAAPKADESPAPPVHQPLRPDQFLLPDQALAYPRPQGQTSSELVESGASHVQGRRRIILLHLLLDGLIVVLYVEPYRIFIHELGIICDGLQSDI